MAEIVAGFDNDGFFEFIELTNTGPTTLDLSGARFVAGIDFPFPADTFLASGAHLVVVANEAAFSMRYPGVPPERIAGEYTGRLENDGELIQLHDAVGENVLKFTYNDRWYPATDGDGHALVILDELAAWEAWDLATSWGIGSPVGGTPGNPNGSVVLQQYEGWLNSHFSEAEIADPLISGPAADANGDGRSNFYHYAFATDPRAANGASHDLPSIEAVDETLELTYRVRDPALDLEITVEESEDLTSWSPVDLQLIESSVDAGGTTVTVVLRDPVTIGLNDGARRFLRVRARKSD